ncbi:TPA: hypothetical protein N0F65_010005 [Lagenidium giganteum]|uniref:Transmembrane protein n=1 Tax=Lagenidium giganteum TaxID=4803 RepID=A0AAV2ZHT6_9STRA|nr:TPA: hypothetical protein N0F65_010005 [Lagenidium giganteum]
MYATSDSLTMADHRLRKSWSFISEGSFSSVAISDLHDEMLALEDLTEEELIDAEELDIQSSFIVPKDCGPSPIHEGHVMPASPHVAVSMAMSMNLGASSFDMDPTAHERMMKDTAYHDIPIAGRKSTALSLPIQLLQDEAQAQASLERLDAGQSFFNHALYGSLRPGDSVNLFSRQCYGLAFSAAASGFMTPFLVECFQPLLCVYLGFDDLQSRATSRFLILPGIISFFIGIVSDFYPLWGCHRKFYMLGGWICAYVVLMVMVFIACLDDSTELMSNNVRTYQGGVIYVLLMMAVSLGTTIASVAASAFLVELSQRERIHERGRLAVTYLITQEVFALLSTGVTACVMDYDHDTGHTKSVISLKVVMLIMALVSLIPIPAILFRLHEDRREVKIDGMERSSLFYRLWKIIQQQAVWRILLFVCGTYFFANFEFEVAKDAVYHWCKTTPNMVRLAWIPWHTLSVAMLVFYRSGSLNHSWIRYSVIALLLTIGMDLIASVPVIFDWIRNSWYLLTILSFSGIPRAIHLLVTTLPVIEITERGLEGATTGLVASFYVLIGSVIRTFSDAISNSSQSLVHDFSPKHLDEDANSTRWRVLEVLIGNYGINLLALVPILYLLPRQKLDAQQMRAYGGFSHVGGIAVVVVFVCLVLYACIVNLLALMKKY